MREKNTVLITGASSGIGKETALYFQKMGWNVIATMRSPEKATDMHKLQNVTLLSLDVTEPASIRNAVNEAVLQFGTIDVLVNNAGFYTIGALETFTDEDIQRQINTNLIGLIRVTKEVLPHMRKVRKGTIINVSSVAGKTTVPIQSLYHAAKWGVEGFTESLQFEVKPFNIHVVLVEPGVIRTDFYGRSMTAVAGDSGSEYRDYVRKVTDYLVSGGNHGSSAAEVGKKIYEVAVLRNPRLRYPVGKSTGILFLHKILPRRLYMKIINRTMAKE